MHALGKLENAQHRTSRMKLGRRCEKAFFSLYALSSRQLERTTWRTTPRPPKQKASATLEENVAGVEKSPHFALEIHENPRRIISETALHNGNPP